MDVMEKMHDFAGLLDGREILGVSVMEHDDGITAHSETFDGGIWFGWDGWETYGSQIGVFHTLVVILVFGMIEKVKIRRC